MTLDILSTNHTSNHNSPLIFSYKYEKLRKKGGGWKVLKEIESRSEKVSA